MSSKSKPNHVGNPLGPYDTNSVRDRIRQWQAQGGGVVSEEDDGSEEGPELKNSTPSIRTPKRELTRKTPSRCDKAKPDTTTPVRSGRNTNDGDEDRNGSAPAKRVVSDGHWRKKSGPPKGTTSCQATRDCTPSWALPDDGVRGKPISGTNAEERGKSKPSPESRSDQRRKTAGMRTEPKRESVGGDGGIRVYGALPGSQRYPLQPRKRMSDLSLSEKDGGSELEDPEASPPTDPIKQRKRPTPEKSLTVISSTPKVDSKRRTSSTQRSVGPDESPSARGPFSEEKVSAGSHKGSILSHIFGDGRKSLVKQAQEPMPVPRVPSIEAWLNETPDPFVDADEPEVEYIAPLKTSRVERKDTPQEKPVEDPNKIWGALDTKEGTRRHVNGSKKKKRIPSSSIYEDNPFPDGFDSDAALSGSGKGTIPAPKIVDLVLDTPKTSPPTLKRRAARKSVSSPVRDRQRRHAMKESNKEEDAASVLSSNPTESSVEGPHPNNPLKPRGLNLRRPFPSTGKHRLSTIASVETFNTRQHAAPPPVSKAPEQTIKDSTIEEDETMGKGWDHFDPNSLKRNNSRLTKHADLISVLSLPRGGNKSIVSARSIRTNRSRLATATVSELMQELATDESKYMRELRTLVDGVIPVLLTCVLSKSDSAVAAGLFRPSAHGDNGPNFTKPIIDMGIALERLKTLHKRIPQDNASALLTWARGAQRVYAEYLRAWRMGFQDVVVNLAPAGDNGSTVSGSSNGSAQVLDEGLPRNENGDVVNGDGERVDVAFLLKRPLVRLKYLAKTLKGINFIKPSAEAEMLATRYGTLVDDARQRLNEERARLEDEAASNIDPTRARDPRTLAPLTGVIIDRTRRVRARDLFNLALQHSSGQSVDCRVELILRDDASDTANGGDLLICEVDGTGRWLLFPPVQFGRVSARNGDLKGEIVVMVKGLSSIGSEWQELFSLISEDEQVGFEWVQMLGLTPVPPKISRSRTFLSQHQGNKSSTESAISSLEPSVISSSLGKSRTPSPREIEVPIGEQANEDSKTWESSSQMPSSPSIPPSRPNAKLQKPPMEPLLRTLSRSSANYVDQVNDLRSLPSQTRGRDSTTSEPMRTPRSFKEALGLSGTSTNGGLKRSRAKRLSRHGDASLSTPKSTDGSRHYRESHIASPDATKADETTAQATRGLDKLPSLSPVPIEGSANNAGHDHQNVEARPADNRKRSSVPSMDLPNIPRVRKDSPPTTPLIEPEEEPVWPVPVDATKHSHSPSSLIKKHPIPLEEEALDSSIAPPTPAHHSPNAVQLSGIKVPLLSQGQIKPRRSSSPLKHEYEPSTASESSSDSETSTVEHNGATSISDSSDEEELEDEDAPTPLIPLGALKRLPGLKESQKIFAHSTPATTIKPSESASQAPYKTVPAQPTKACKTIASIFSWSDIGSWQSLHPDECSIVITPGLIEAFEMSAAHSKIVPPSSSNPIADPEAFSDLASNLTTENDVVQGERPLVALELTPLVPLRRGTALDISIRSPPTPNSRITSGNNIMFRSRNPEECEALYALINHSRINNPTFIALQNARASGTSFHPGRHASTSAGNSRHSWFGGWGRSSSYRASSAPTPSIAMSESSIGSMSSAFSALKRFGKGGGMFSISRSSISSREGSRANSIYASSDHSSGSGTNSPVPPGMVSAGRDAPIGLSNAKIRLYLRETASRWRDMGSARMTIMRPERDSVGPDGGPTSSGGARHGVNEKRIVVHGKTKGEVLLDVQLGESCFERVARTGIALSVWEDVVGPNGEVGVVGAVGGVGGGRAKVYMIQMKSEAETAYTFSIVGKLRY